ncbi:MAG: hypothetical protein QHI38_05240 [Armatimonadota bacterium]|nr:hypothetical protein [Armatimonadota bacterium]
MMNALPVGPEYVSSPERRARYFEDLERWGFDTAYNAFYAHPYDDVVGKLRSSYIDFASEARKRGYPACIQIQITVCAGDRVGIEEAQYNEANEPERWGQNGFFGSFSSDAWLDYLKEITQLFVGEYGYNRVVFEEPMYRVDIPGTKDRFYQKFVEAHPDVAYPSSRTESREYLKVQQAKAESLTRFCSELVAHAKSVGAEAVGVMPWFFIPTIENTPAGTLNPSCDIKAISKIEGLDFLVVRMQPDNIFCGTMRTGDEMTRSPLLYYIEVMAHALGKPIIAVSNPSDEHTDYPSLPLIPFDFYRDATVAAVAAAPNGFTRHWYGQNYGKDTEHMAVLSSAAQRANRLGNPRSPVAFVFSYAGTRHAEPWTYETVFKHYWALAKELAFNHGVPMLTFHADTLSEDLAAHPEVRVLVFDEHFPLNRDQFAALRRWWKPYERRAAVLFASGLGFAAGTDIPGAVPSTLAHPGLLELMGLKQAEEAPQLPTKTPLTLAYVSRVRRKAFLGESAVLDTDVVANVKRAFGSRADVLYAASVDESQVPVVAEYRDRSTIAIFCGFGLTQGTANAAAKAVLFAMRESHALPLVLEPCTKGLLWNTNKLGYVIVGNVSDETGRARLNVGRALVWDCERSIILPEGVCELEIPPHGFWLCRVFSRRSKLLDVIGASAVYEIIDGSGRADIRLLAGRRTNLVVRYLPETVLVDGRPSSINCQPLGSLYSVTVEQCPPGQHLISVRW